MTEIWRDIKGYPNYQVSNLGRIKSLKRYVGVRSGSKRVVRERILKRHMSAKGYCNATLRLNNKQHTKSFHRLVALAFIPNPKNKRTINHINGIKTDNRVENLEWNTYKENSIHAHKMGLASYKKGECNPTAKLKDKEVVEIIKLFNSNLTLKKIGEMYNVSLWAIKDIKYNRRWTHIERNII
jgi:hypothetical protein